MDIISFDAFQANKLTKLHGNALRRDVQIPPDYGTPPSLSHTFLNIASHLLTHLTNTSRDHVNSTLPSSSGWRRGHRRKSRRPRISLSAIGHPGATEQISVTVAGDSSLTGTVGGGEDLGLSSSAEEGSARTRKTRDETLKLATRLDNLVIKMSSRRDTCEGRVKAISYCHKLPLLACRAAPELLQQPADPFYSPP